MKSRFDWTRFLRLLGWVSTIITGAFMFSAIFGAAGHMALATLDAALGARLFPQAPWIPYAALGALIGIGPALWSIPGLRTRRLLLFVSPIIAFVFVGTFFTVCLAIR